MRFFQTFDNIIDDLRGKSLLLKKSRETVSLKNKEYQQKLQEYETLKEYFTKSATGRSIVDSIEDKFKSYNSSFLDLVKREEKIQNKLQKSIDSIYRKNPDIVKLQEYKNIIPENKFTELLVTLTKSYKQGLISKDRVLDLKKYKRVDLEKGSVYVKDDRTHYSDCIVINELNEVLLLKRNKLDDFEAAKYCLPGGHVDDGEDFQYAALRELIEETGIKSETAVPSGEYTDNKIVIHYFTVKVEKDKCNVFLDEREHQQYEWVSIDDIHNYPLIKNLDKNFEDVILIPSWVINHDLAPNFYIWNNSGGFLSKSEIKQVYLANKLYKSYKDGLMDYEHYKNHIQYNDIDVQMFSIYNLSQKPLYGLKLINSIEKSEKIEGELADGKSIEEIATHHNTSVEQISKQFEMGIKVEMEHTNDRERAEEIAKDHLWEIPDYYTRLDKMESEAKKEVAKEKEAPEVEFEEEVPKEPQKLIPPKFPADRIEKGEKPKEVKNKIKELRSIDIDHSDIGLEKISEKPVEQKEDTEEDEGQV